MRLAGDLRPLVTAVARHLQLRTHFQGRNRQSQALDQPELSQPAGEEMIGDALARRTFRESFAVAGASCLAGSACGQDRGIKEPVYRVSKNDAPPGGAPGERHPLDPALDMARDAIKLIQRDIADYKATIVKRERIKGVLGEH